MIKKQATNLAAIRKGDDIIAKVYKGDTLRYNSALPYDAEVEYLQGDGTAYIDTQYSPVQGDEITVEFQSLATISSSYYCLFSSGTGTYQLIALFGNRQNVTGSFCKYFASGNAQWLAHSFSGWETMTIKQDGTFSIGSDSVRSPYEHSLDGNNASLFILRRRDGTSGLPAKLRKFSITNNNVTKKDFIPVRKDGVGYLYDKVSGQLFGNAASSGAFIFGNDVTSNDTNSLNFNNVLLSSLNGNEPNDEPNEIDPIAMEDM